MAGKYVHESSDELDGIDAEDNEGEEAVTVEPYALLERDEGLALILVIWFFLRPCCEDGSILLIFTLIYS